MTRRTVLRSQCASQNLSMWTRQLAGPEYGCRYVRPKCHQRRQGEQNQNGPEYLTPPPRPSPFRTAALAERTDSATVWTLRAGSLTVPTHPAVAGAIVSGKFGKIQVIASHQ